jgi:hypothetical protein
MRILFYAFASLCLGSCSSNDNANGTLLEKADTQTVSKYDFKLSHAPLSFSGLWVNEKYVINIKKDKSPRSSQDISESCISIPDSTLEVTNMISGFHEGAADLVVVKNGDRYELYDKGFADPARIIELISTDKIKIGDKTFIKLKHPNKKRNDLNILGELLFSGHYKLDNGKDVEFNLDGHISGLDSLNYYEPIIDYVGSGMDVDQIELGAREKQLQPFGFKFKSDSLFIYKLHCVEGYDSVTKECGVVEFGDLKYKLLRKG